MISQLIALVCSYLVGAIPTGYIIGRLKGIADIRQHGSGNIGATNVARMLGAKYFALVFVIDALKAYGVLKLGIYSGLSEQMLVACALALMLGNTASIFLSFKGGKGVATCIGILLALKPLLLAIFFVVWLPVLLYTKTVGIASVAAFVVMPFVAAILYVQTFNNEPISVALLLGLICICVCGIYLHKENIRKYFF